MRTKQKGITLVALVITIILLLILAGISISQLTGSGLFENAKEAKQKSEESQKKEENILGNYENTINTYLDNTRTQTQSSSIQDTLLWQGSICNVGETATLNDSIENYKYIILETKWAGSNAFFNTLLNVTTIKELGYFENNNSYTNSHALINMYSTYYMYLLFSSNNSLTITAIGSDTTPSHYLTKVIGIK